MNLHVYSRTYIYMHMNCLLGRYKESLERPKAFEDFGAALQRIRKVIDLYDKKVCSIKHPILSIIPEMQSKINFFYYVRSFKR